MDSIVPLGVGNRGPRPRSSFVETPIYFDVVADLGRYPLPIVIEAEPEGAPTAVAAIPQTETAPRAIPKARRKRRPATGTVAARHGRDAT